MRKVQIMFVIVLLVGLVVSVPAAAENTEGRYVILFGRHALPEGLASTVEGAGGRLVRSFPQVGVAIAVSSEAGFVDAMSGVRGVASVGDLPAFSLPNIEMYGEPEGPTVNDDLYNAGLVWGVNRVNAPAAWAGGYTGSHDTVVAIIDTGIAWNHPDLAPNIVHVDCYTSEATCNPYPSLDWHGTHVAGTVAAAFDGGRVVGVGPDLGLAGYNTFEVIPGCGVCAYSDSRWAAMIDAADRDFDVINMSLGGYGVYGGQGSNDLATYVAAEKRIANYVNQAGTVMVASAGNDAINLNGTIIHLPGDIPGMISVSATGIWPSIFAPEYDVLADYSNYGAPVDIAAPGGDLGPPDTPYPFPAVYHLVLSSYVIPDPVCALSNNCPIGYAWAGGTSMAAPHVAGGAGLVLDANPGLNPHQVKSILTITAESIGSRQLFGHGMLDVSAAVMKADR